MICFYYKDDLDGKCSAAIIRLKHPECRLYGLTYGDAFPWEMVTIGETVFMVDFSLPIGDMLKLSERCNLVLIDHHKTVIESLNTIYFKGIQKEGLGACALVWQFCRFSYPMPYAVKLLAEYDVWRFDDSNTLPF